MNDELLLRASKLFDTAEKWNAFCELMNVNDQIQNRWWERLQTEVLNRELKNPTPGWEIHTWYNWDIKWYVDDNSNGLVIHFWAEAFRVYWYSELNTDKVNQFLDKNPNYVTAIRNCFDRIDGIGHSTTIASEYRNFSFGTIHDGHFPDRRTLSWYAGNETEKFADQLIAKVRRFQTPEITAIFREINSKCKA